MSSASNKRAAPPPGLADELRELTRAARGEAVAEQFSQLSEQMRQAARSGKDYLEVRSALSVELQALMAEAGLKLCHVADTLVRIKW